MNEKNVTKTIKVKDSAELTYYDDQRLYLVIATDIATGNDVPLFNLNNDKMLATAEMEFDGYLDPIFYPLDDYLAAINEKEGLETI